MQEGSQMEEEQVPPPNFGRFSSNSLLILVFLLAKTAQQAYGVKTGDYARYRRYCSRKVLKLR